MVASNDPVYLQHSGDFRRIVDKRMKKAADDNLEACALVWLDVTMSCLECHEFMRCILVANDEHSDLDQLSLLTPAKLRERLADKSINKTSVNSKQIIVIFKNQLPTNANRRSVMIVIKKILVPTDFSEPSDNALRYAKELATKFESKIILLHVMGHLISGYSEMGLNMVPLSDVEKELTEQAKKHLDDVDIPDSQPVQRELRHGSAFLEIIRCAKEHDVDLIVMGTHGRGVVAHVLLGSVAERVVRKAPCPVLTVRDPEHEFIMP